MESPTTSIVLEKNGLYILVSDMGEKIYFHWGLYLAKQPGKGDVFHMINNKETGFKWQYQHKISEKVEKSFTLTVALKVAVMDPSLHQAIKERLRAVSTASPITCRLWLKRALTDLDNEERKLQSKANAVLHSFTAFW